MPTRLVHLVVDAADPAGLARFWSGALEWPVTFEEPDEVVIEPPDDGPAQAGQLPLVFVPVPEPKTSKNRVHLDVASTSEDHKVALVARLEGLGARQIDIGQPDDVSWVVMADPEGNEFCVLTLADRTGGGAANNAMAMSDGSVRRLGGIAGRRSVASRAAAHAASGGLGRYHGHGVPGDGCRFESCRGHQTRRSGGLQQPGAEG